MIYHHDAGNHSASIRDSNVSLCGTSAAVCWSMRCRDRLARVHEHPFADVWGAARQKQTTGNVHPDAAYNALAVMSQVTVGDALAVLKLQQTVL